MKVLFAGPSLAADLPALAVRHPEVRFAGPVARGDLVAAVADGATAVGIVDGLFADVPPVWHKEILFALSEGVAVAGGASMGALRAAECGAFGMVGLGRVHDLVASGSALDDGCVAQVHAPAYLGWTALTEAEVTVGATLEAMAAARAVEPAALLALARASAGLAYRDRTLARIAEMAAAELAPGDAAGLAADLRAALELYRSDVKRADGLLVVDWLLAQPARRGPPPRGWTFRPTPAWRALLEETALDPAGGPP